MAVSSGAELIQSSYTHHWVDKRCGYIVCMEAGLHIMAGPGLDAGVERAADRPPF